MTIAIEELRSSVEVWFLRESLSVPEILDRLSQADVQVTKRTLERRLSQWGLRKQSRVVDSVELRAAVVRSFQLSTGDDVAIRSLRRQGFDLSIKQFRDFRKSLGLYKRVAKEEHDEDNGRIEAVLRTEYDNGGIDQFGKHHLYTYMRRKHLIIGRERIATIARSIDPTGFANRRKRAMERRGTYRVKGPNYAWSIDAHCKLQYWGIEIYAAIDVYSRFVIWFYVGVSSRTAIAVLSQYVQAIQDSGIIPVIIKSDRGAETVLAADLHYQLRSTIHNENRNTSDPSSTSNSAPLLLVETFRYGTSKQNQRIEKWWQDIAKSCLNPWRSWFLELKERELFIKDLIADRVAFLAIYVPIIRVELAKFTSLWNDHRIRKDRRKGHVSGIPELLYHEPENYGAEDCSIDVPIELLANIKHELGQYDLDLYLPVETLKWCRQVLQQKGFINHLNQDVDGARHDTDGVRDHRRAYIQLRDVARVHCVEGRSPILKECERPTGSRWEPSEAMRAAFAAAGEAYTEEQPLQPGWDNEL